MARPGDVVELRGGTYPSQTVTVDGSKVHADASVTFRPARGARIVIAGDLHVLGSHMVFEGVPGTRDFRLRYLYSDPTDGPDTSNHVSFDFLDGAAFQIGPNIDITIRGGDWGPNECGGEPSIEPSVTPLSTAPGRVPTNIALVGLHIFRQSSPDLARCHIGGLSVVSANGLVVRDTIFSQNMVYDVAVGDFTHVFGNPRNVVFENDVFGAPVSQDGKTDDGQPEMQTEDPGLYDNWLIRFNSFKNGVSLDFDGGGVYRDVRVLGNIGERGDCAGAGDGATWAYNIWTEGRCGPTDQWVRTLPYVRTEPSGEEDFHLRPRTRAIAFVTQASPDLDLAKDISGARRPTNRAAGAYE
jgi:hypothetical protein